MPIGTNEDAKWVAAQRRWALTACSIPTARGEFTFMEEATEFLQRVKTAARSPNKLSPGPVKFCETIIRHDSKRFRRANLRKQMFGALTKTTMRKMGLDPHDIVCVSVMPCTAKKFEIGRDDMSAAGDNIPDVDISITTRELGRMIERAGIKFTELPDEDFDPALGESTGAPIYALRRRDGSGLRRCGACDGRDAGELGISRRARNRRASAGNYEVGGLHQKVWLGSRQPHQLRRSAEGCAERREALHFIEFSMPSAV
jgi:hypothetical protein